MQDGDLLYEVSGKDLAYFKQLTIHRKNETQKSLLNEQLSGVFKYKREDNFRHLNANVRPHSTNSIARKIERA